MVLWRKGKNLKFSSDTYYEVDKSSCISCQSCPYSRANSHLTSLVSINYVIASSLYSCFSIWLANPDQGLLCGGTSVVKFPS